MGTEVVLEREGHEPLTLVLDEALRDDMEFFETLCDLDENNVLAMGRLIKQMLGAEQKKKLYDWLREDTGRVKVTEVAKYIPEIFKALGTNEKK